MPNYYRLQLAGILLFCSTALAQATEDCCYDEDYYDQECCCVADVPPNHCRPVVLSLGPEVYHVERTRQAGTKQTGTAVGVRFTADYIKRYCIYAGMQAFYGSGVLEGHTNGGDKTRARLTDAQIEGSLGYTFQMKCCPYVAITPYAGFGYFREVTKFSPPSPLILKYTITYPYVAFGFLSSIYVTPYLTAGFNARFRSPWQTRCKVSDDPEFENLRQNVEDCLQYRLELPLTYTGSLVYPGFEIALVPFYERRLYGARENFPFDFFQTKLKIYGINLQLVYRF